MLAHRTFARSLVEDWTGGPLALASVRYTRTSAAKGGAALGRPLGSIEIPPRSLAGVLRRAAACSVHQRQHGMRFATALLAASLAAPVLGSPVPAQKRWAFAKYFDLQAHRGGRGVSCFLVRLDPLILTAALLQHVAENTLPAFAVALINGVTSLEMDVVRLSGHELGRSKS